MWNRNAARSLELIPSGLMAVVALLSMIAGGTSITTAQGTRGPAAVFRPRDPVTGDFLRPSDVRPKRDAAAAEQLGIRRYASTRLELYSDIDPAAASPLPLMLDQVYPQWTAYFGDLPRNPESTEYQITGFLFGDEGRFSQANLLPQNLPNFRQGRHRGQEFWVAEQDSDYFRRHIVIHEATHCFMTTMPTHLPPIWYLEGMAELFATHRINTAGQVVCRVFPDQPENFRGLGRIEMIQDEVRAGRGLSLLDIGSIPNERFIEDRTVPYSWAWALCAFLDQHPRYRERFKQLSKNLELDQFRLSMSQMFEKDLFLLNAEFDEFVQRIAYGYDFNRNAFVESNIAAGLSKEIQVPVKANLGWQSTGIQLRPGQRVEFTATGRVVLAKTTGDWASEPSGISIRYCNGVPIGALLGALMPTQLLAGEDQLPRLDYGVIGKTITLTANRPATLYLRVNDFANELADNSGEYTVTLTPLGDGE